MRILATLLLAALSVAACAQTRTVYRCPGNVYTSEITDKEAKDRGCRTIEGAPITIVAPPKPRPQQGAASGPRGEGEKVDAKELARAVTDVAHAGDALADGGVRPVVDVDECTLLCDVDAPAVQHMAARACAFGGGDRGRRSARCC